MAVAVRGGRLRAGLHLRRRYGGRYQHAQTDFYDRGCRRGRPAARPDPVPPTATAVVVQQPEACAAARATPPAVPAAARRLAAAGAELSLVCGAADATGAVVRAAARHAAVLGAGPDVRAALALAAADHPAVRFGPLR